MAYDQMRFSRNKFRYAKHKCLNPLNLISKDRLIESSQAGDKDLFAELRKCKGSPQNIATRVDGHTEPESIADHLKGIYETLYNRTGTDEPLKNLLGEVDGMITEARKD